MILSLIAAAVLGIVILGYYWFYATFELFDCVNLMSDAPYPPSHKEGAQDESVYAAVLITAAAWLGTWRITTTTRLRRWPPLLVLVFAAVDIAALALLWSLAPVIWGPEHCVPD